MEHDRKPLLDHMYELHLDLLDITVLELLSTTLTDPQETLQFIKSCVHIPLPLN